MATVLLVLVAWIAVSAVVILAGRILGRVSAPPPRTAAPEAPPASGNVVALVPRARNELARGETLREAS